jgi:hypothetical protein
MSHLSNSDRLPNAPLIIQKAKELQQAVNQLGFFRPPYSLSLEVSPSLPGMGSLSLSKVESGLLVPSMMSVNYSLNEDTYCTLVFEMEEREEGRVFTSFIPSVYSNLRFGTGTFLFYLQILLAHRCGARYIVLDNDANNTERSARGIYKWFRPNNRNMNHRQRERLQQAESMYNKLSISGGKMVLDLQEFSLDTWKEHVNGISRTGKNNQDRPWADGSFSEKVDRLASSASPSSPSPSYGPVRRSTRAKSRSPYSRGGLRKTRRAKRQSRRKSSRTLRK